MKQASGWLLITTICIFLTSCDKGKKSVPLAYCPTADAVKKAIDKKSDYVKVSIGEWKINILNKTTQLKFLRASYTSGWPACLYGPKGKYPTVELSPRVTPELFPIWDGTNNGKNQWNAPDCVKENVKDCPWKAVSNN